MMTTEEVTRRTFVSTGLAVGFALAAQPVSAETIHTDSSGLVAGEVTVTGPDGFKIPAYEAHPAKGGKHPVVLVVQEIFGVHEHIKDLCRRLAKRGYYAIAPELYARQGDVSKISDFREIIGQVVSKVTDAQVMGDLDATVAFAKATGKTNTAKLAITGFCWGGRVVWLYSAHNPKVKAGAAWYGQLSKGFSPTAQTALQIAPTLTVPVIGFYGGQDNGIPQTDVAAMNVELAKGKTGSYLEVFADAGHGFNADYRPSYNEKDAKEAWGKMLAWFKQHGAS